MTGGATIGKGDTVVGSVHYSSPEQATGSVVEATSDLYSTGVVMYEMLTGRVPFVGDTPVAVAMQHIQDAPPPITDFAPETPPAVVAVVMKALEKDPKNRFQTAREMAEALMKAKDGRLDPSLLTPEVSRIPVPQPPQPSHIQEVSPRGSQPPRRTGTAARRAPARRRVRYKISSLVITILVSAAALGLLAFGVVRIVEEAGRTVLAPDVIGMTVEDAMTMARREELEWKQTDINHDTIAAGLVISQIPEADTAMEKGDSLLVTVSLGSVSATMPDMRGLGYEDAATRLKERGFGNIIAMKIVSTASAGTVLEQVPQAGDGYTPGQSVELTISGGSAMVPEVTGRKLEEALKMLSDNGLAAGKPVSVETTDPAQIGQVLAQSPTSGSMVVVGAPITLTVGIESQPYQGELSLSIPAAAQERTLRITLVINDSETTEYEGTLAAGSESVMLIPLSATLSGDLPCRIYLNGELFQEQTVTLR